MIEQNPYAPPAAPVRPVEVPDAAPAEAPLYAVGLPKMVALSLGTLGLYGVYWFYRQWKGIKEQGLALGASPIPRAIFAVFFCYPCFAKVRELGEQRLPDRRLPAGPLATGWIILALAGRAPSPWFLLTFLSVVFLLPVQAYANRLNAVVAPDHDRNGGIKGWNWLVVAVGLPLFVVLVIGAFLPDTAGGG